jgi:hypothetical protein
VLTGLAYPLRPHTFPTSPVFLGAPQGSDTRMLLDIVVAIIIVAIAAILGLVVHPILWIILIAALLWLFTRRNSWARRY